MGFPGGSDGKASACSAGDLVSIPGLGRSPREGHGNTLQYSCLENPCGQRSLAAAVHGVAESDRTKQLSVSHTREIYNVVLVSGVQPSDSVIYIHTYIQLKILNAVPCDIQSLCAVMGIHLPVKGT